MPESDIDFTRYAGHVVFPRTPQDLTNTTICPACLSPLASAVCGVCRLDLNHPAAAELFALSTDAAAALVHRLSVIGRIRYETTQLLEQQGAAPAETLAQAASFADLMAADPAIADPAIAADAAAPTSPTSPAIHPTTPRRSSVQVVMLIVGVSLLSIAAIFFLVFAFITYGLLTRSIIIGSITLAAFVVASLLKRRSLRSSAEGIAVFAIVLVYLDAFAARANDLAGLGSADGAVFWGVTLIGSAIVFVLWHRTSTLRVPNIVGFAAFLPGVGLLVVGLTTALETPAQFFSAFAVAAIAGLVHPLATGRKSGTTPALAAHAERVIVASIACFSLICAFFAAFAMQPDNTWASVVSLLVVAVIGLVHVLIASRTSASRGVNGFGVIFAAVGAIAAAATGTALAMRLGDFAAALFWPAVIAAFVALALELAARRTGQSTLSRPARAAAVSAATVAAITVIIPIVSSLLLALVVPVRGLASAWTKLATAATFTHNTESVIAIASLAAVTLLVAGFWATSGLFRRRSAILLWAAATVVVLAVPLIGVVWATATGWLLLAAIGIVLLVITRQRMSVRASLRLPIAAGSITAMTLGYSTSWASIDAWGWASLATIVMLLAGRCALRKEQPIPRSVLLAAAIVAALVGAGALALQLPDANTTEWTSGIDALRFVGILAILLVAAAAAVPASFASGFASAIDRRVTYWIALPVALVVTLGSASSVSNAGRQALDGLFLPEFGTSLVLGLALLCALLLWVVPRTSVTGTASTAAPVAGAAVLAGAMRPERIVASIAVAPTVYWVVDSFARVLGLPEYARMTAPIVAALLVAVGSLAVTLLRATNPHPTTARTSSLPRWVRETSIALVAVPAVLFAVATDQDAAWLVLLLAGITALILAISTDGLFASASLRRHFSWLAILLATAGLWWRLAGDQVSALEPYVLPVSGILLLVAYLIWRAADRAAKTGSPERSPAPSSAAPLVALGGLLVAILPLSADATTGDVVRAFVIGAISAILLLSGVFIVASSALRPYLDAAAFTGALGVLITGAGRSVFLVLESGGSNDARLDIWLGGTFLVLMLAAVGIPWVDDATDGPRDRRQIAAQALAVLAMTSVLVLEAASLESDSLGPVRAFAVTVLFSLLYLASVAWRRAPFTPSVGWISLGFAAVTAMIGMAVGALDPIEFGTLPIAIALLVGGALHLAGNPHARSWPHLGPGILVMLVPSLIATATLAGGTDRPLWRLVGLGVLAIATLVVGVVRRLQAPFVLGVLVALVHGIATFSHEIRVVYEAVPWWLWLGIGGVLLIVLAARYEKRIKNLKDVALTVGALR